MAVVVPFGGVTRLDLPTERVLDAARGHCTDGVVIVGFDDDGKLYFASSVADGGTALWLLEQAKKALLEVDG